MARQRRLDLTTNHTNAACHAKAVEGPPMFVWFVWFVVRKAAPAAR